MSLTLQLTNNTGSDVVGIVGAVDGITTVGNAAASLTANHITLAKLRNGFTGNLTWNGTASGLKGLVSIHLSATGEGCGGVSVETNSIECPTLLVPPRP